MTHVILGKSLCPWATLSCHLYNRKRIEMSYFSLNSRSLKRKWSKKGEKCNFMSPNLHNSHGPISVNSVFVSETCIVNVTYIPSDLPSDRQLVMDRHLFLESQGLAPWERSHLPLYSHSHPPFYDKNKTVNQETCGLFPRILWGHQG